MASTDQFRGSRVIATEKLDGQNITLYRDYFHSRSVEASSHPSRLWLEKYWRDRREAIPQGWRICGEYLLLRHSVAYSDLPSFFVGFAVWNERNVCIGWDETMVFLSKLNIHHATVIFDGHFNIDALGVAWSKARRVDGEGYVLRVAGPIEYGQFRHKVGKFLQDGYFQREPDPETAVEVNSLRGSAIQCATDQKVILG